MRLIFRTFLSAWLISWLTIGAQGAWASSFSSLSECSALSADPAIQEQCFTCLGASDKIWNSSTNVCETSKSAAAARSSAQNCLYDSGDYSTSDCFTQQGQDLLDANSGDQQTDHTNAEGVNWVGIAPGVLGAAAIVVTLVTGAKITTTCAHPSNALLVAGGVVAMLGNIAAPLYLAYQSGKNNTAYTDYISAKSTELTASGTPVATPEAGSGLDQANWDSQSVAFDFMLAQKKAEKTSLTINATSNALAAGLYLAASIAGMIEIAKGIYTGEQSICPSAPQGEAKAALGKKILGLLPILAMAGTLGVSLMGTMKQTGAEGSTDTTGSPFPTDTYFPNKNFDKGLSIADFVVLETEKNAAMDFEGQVTQSPSLDFYQTISMETQHLTPLWNNFKSLLMPEAHASANSDILKGMADTMKNADKGCSTTPQPTGCDAFNSAKNKYDTSEASVNSAWWRVGTGFVSGAITGAMSGFSIYSVDQVNKQIETITNIKQAMLQGLSNNCFNRDDASEPLCYCYLATGEINAERATGPTCTAVLNSFAFGETTDYGNTVLGSGAGCIDLVGNVDPTCECAKTTNRLGQTACASTTNANISMQLGNNDWFSSMTSNADGLLSGKTSAASMDAASLLNAAGRAAKQAQKMADDLDKKLVSDGKKPLGLNALGNKMLAARLESAKKEVAANGAPTSLGLAATNNLPAEAKAILANVQKEVDKKISYTNGSGTGRDNKTNNNALFGSGPGMAVKGKVLDDIMGKEFAIKGDINTNPDVSLWDTITRRYNETGLQRLFGDSEPAKAPVAPVKEAVKPAPGQDRVPTGK